MYVHILEIEINDYLSTAKSSNAHITDNCVLVVFSFKCLSKSCVVYFQYKENS